MEEKMSARPILIWKNKIKLWIQLNAFIFHFTPKYFKKSLQNKQQM